MQCDITAIAKPSQLLCDSCFITHHSNPMVCILFASHSIYFKEQHNPYARQSTQAEASGQKQVAAGCVCCIIPGQRRVCRQAGA